MRVAFVGETTCEGGGGGNESVKKGRCANTRTWMLGEGKQGHDGSPFSAELATSRSLASASILLKLRSSTGLINTLNKAISPFCSPKSYAQAEHAPVYTCFEVLFLVQQQGIPRHADHEVLSPRFP